MIDGKICLKNLDDNVDNIEYLSDRRFTGYVDDEHLIESKDGKSILIIIDEEKLVVMINLETFQLEIFQEEFLLSETFRLDYLQREEKFQISVTDHQRQVIYTCDASEYYGLPIYKYDPADGKFKGTHQMVIFQDSDRYALQSLKILYDEQILVVMKRKTMMSDGGSDYLFVFSDQDCHDIYPFQNHQTFYPLRKIPPQDRIAAHQTIQTYIPNLYKELINIIVNFIV